MKIGTTFSFAYAHRLLNHPGKCLNLHGHNGKVEIEVGGEIVAKTGMVLDFDILKVMSRDWVMSQFDHTTILQEGDPLIDHIKTKLVILSHPPTAEILAFILVKQMKILKFPEVRVRFWESENNYAECSNPEEEDLDVCWVTR